MSFIGSLRSRGEKKTLQPPTATSQPTSRIFTPTPLLTSVFNSGNSVSSCVLDSGKELTSLFLSQCSMASATIDTNQIVLRSLENDFHVPSTDLEIIQSSISSLLSPNVDEHCNSIHSSLQVVSSIFHLEDFLAKQSLDSQQSKDSTETDQPSEHISQTTTHDLLGPEHHSDIKSSLSSSSLANVFRKNRTRSDSKEGVKTEKPGRKSRLDPARLLTMLEGVTNTIENSTHIAQANQQTQFSQTPEQIELLTSQDSLKTNVLDVSASLDGFNPADNEIGGQIYQYESLRLPPRVKRLRSHRKVYVCDPTPPYLMQPELRHVALDATEAERILQEETSYQTNSLVHVDLLSDSLPEQFEETRIATKQSQNFEVVEEPTTIADTRTVTPQHVLKPKVDFTIGVIEHSIEAQREIRAYIRQQQRKEMLNISESSQHLIPINERDSWISVTRKKSIVFQDRNMRRMLQKTHNRIKPKTRDDDVLGDYDPLTARITPEAFNTWEQFLAVLELRKGNIQKGVDEEQTDDTFLIKRKTRKLAPNAFFLSSGDMFSMMSEISQMQDTLKNERSHPRPQNINSVSPIGSPLASPRASRRVAPLPPPSVAHIKLSEEKKQKTTQSLTSETEDQVESPQTPKRILSTKSITVEDVISAPPAEDDSENDESHVPTFLIQRALPTPKTRIRRPIKKVVERKNETEEERTRREEAERRAEEEERRKLAASTRKPAGMGQMMGMQMLMAEMNKKMISMGRKEEQKEEQEDKESESVEQIKEETEGTDDQNGSVSSADTSSSSPRPIPPSISSLPSQPSSPHVSPTPPPTSPSHSSPPPTHHPTSQSPPRKPNTILSKEHQPKSVMKGIARPLPPLPPPPISNSTYLSKADPTPISTKPVTQILPPISKPQITPFQPAARVPGAAKPEGLSLSFLDSVLLEESGG
ncbi:hypothetical protein BLNAU_4061 [Blattamonas nauphoetae]|uniref:WH2 domain-containing protein n=1 Tax=Blattamonas nauphoetae TaxID=2049346 RepID=A0ABQ9YB78_9EUKA|nr:hypothetical protein BLNAU_4061 [Blattamonas nauphoetae]